ASPSALKAGDVSGETLPPRFPRRPRVRRWKEPLDCQRGRLRSSSGYWTRTRGGSGVIATATLEAHSGRQRSSEGDRRMIVAWQDPQTRRIVPIGVLSHDDARYGYAYLESVRDIDGFRPLLGFRDLNRQYTSETLFHLFAQRAMSP